MIVNIYPINERFSIEVIGWKDSEKLKKAHDIKGLFS